jgi:hypothetical protein
MRSVRTLIIVAAGLALAPAGQADAAYCGLGGMIRGLRSGRCCPGPVAPCYREKCYTVWKSVPHVEYETRSETLYRTVFETKYEKRPVTYYTHVPRVHCQSVPYTYYTPKYETYTQTYTKAFYRPVHEMQSRVVTYNTFHTYYETLTQVVPYTVVRPVYETRSAVHSYTVYRTHYDTVTQPVAYTVYRPTYETHSRPVPYTVCRQVPYKETVPIHSGCWKTVTEERPGPVVTKCIREPGCWEWDPCACRSVYKPGAVRRVEVQCPPVKTCRKVWVPRVDYKEVTRHHTVYETHYKTVPYTVCRQVPEVRHTTRTYTVCRMIPQVVTKPYTYTAVRYVPETHTRVVPYTVARVVPRTHSYTVNYPVVRLVPDYQTYTVPYTVCRMVPRTSVRKVSYTTWQTIPHTKTICVPRVIPRQVPYTVTRCVPRVTYKRVPVKICVPVTDCECSAPPAHDGHDYGYGPSAQLMPSPVAEPAADEEKPAPVKIVSMQKKAGAAAARELFASGVKLFHQGAYEAAAREFAAAAELSPIAARHLYFQALATYQLGDREAAESLAKHAVALEKSHPGESWGRMMERVQGPHRIWLEDARRRYQSEPAELAAKSE